MKDINPGPGNSSPTEMAPVRDNGLTFFAAATEATGVELWASDGTEAGTVLWQDLAPGDASSNPGYFTKAGGLVFFITGSDVDGWQLWGTRVDPAADDLAIFMPAVSH